MSARLRLITEVSSHARQRDTRAEFEERFDRFARRLLLDLGAQRKEAQRRERRRKAVKLSAFTLALLVLVFGANAPHALLRDVAMRAAQTATLFAALLIIGIVLKTARDATRLTLVQPKDGTTAGASAPREK